MSYEELCEEDFNRLESIWKRCLKMLKDAQVRNNYVMCSYDAGGLQVAHFLWMLDRGFKWSTTARDGKIEYRSLDLHFESLEELELKLAMRGY